MKRLSALHNYPEINTPDARPYYTQNPQVRTAAEARVIELVDHECLMGVEIEVENVGRAGAMPIWPCFWTITEDNSLRNHGYEFITHPLSGVNLIAALQTFFTALPAQAHFSQRTSIHVHMNVRDLNAEQLTTLTVVYLALEKVLYNFVGKDRDKNIFCVPLGTTRTTEKLFQSLMRLKSRIERVQDEQTRYSGLNFGPLFSLGTIEFRQMAGTRDFEKIFTWINLLQCLRKYALAHTLDDTLKTIVGLNTNSLYKNFVLSVFGNHYYKIPVIEDAAVEQGVLVVKRSIVNNKLKTNLHGLIGSDQCNPLLIERYKSTLNKYKAFILDDIVEERPGRLGDAVRFPDAVRFNVQPPAAEALAGLARAQAQVAGRVRGNR